MSLTAAHPRTRERWMALYEICLGKSATQVAKDSQRNSQTVMDWVHRYNNNGPEALKFRHIGGHRPIIVLERSKQLQPSSRLPSNLYRPIVLTLCLWSTS